MQKLTLRISVFAVTALIAALTNSNISAADNDEGSTTVSIESPSDPFAVSDSTSTVTTVGSGIDDSAERVTSTRVRRPTIRKSYLTMSRMLPSQYLGDLARLKAEVQDMNDARRAEEERSRRARAYSVQFERRRRQMRPALRQLLEFR